MKTLKKTILLLAFSIGVVTNINAQSGILNQDAKFGLRGGINLSNLYTKDVDQNNILYGFNLGLFAEFPLVSGFSIQPEINYSTKGAELKYDNAFAKGSAQFRLNYIEVPLLLKANLTENFNLQFGPYIAYLVSAKITNKDANGNINFEDQVKEDDLNRFDAGLAAGFGFDFGGIGLGARYNYGFTTVGKEKTILGQKYTYPDSKNSVFSLYATVKF